MKKRILLLVNDIHFKGGGERVASEIASFYASEGYDSCILSMAQKRLSSLFPLHQNVEIKYLGIANTKFTSKFQVLSGLKKFFKENTFDYVLGIGTYANVMLGMVTSGKSIFIGCEHNAFNSVSLVWRMLRKFTYPRLNATVILTNKDIPFMKKLNPNTFVIPNSIKPTHKRASLKEKNILAIGKLYYQKGFDLMIDMFDDFCKENKDWILTIIGEGIDREKLLEKIKHLQLENRIRILPQTDQIEQVYLHSSVYLMTSRFEGLPMVLLEAQSYGIPIISYDCDTGPRDVIIDGRNGYLVPFNNKHAMVSSLLKICEEDELRYEMGENAKEDIKRFSPEKIFEQWNILFEKLEHDT